jgi:predicted MPP superfamily phosphohydrolase
MPQKGPWIQFRQPTGFLFRKTDLPLADLPTPLRGLRILHLADLHLHRQWPQPLDHLIELFQANPPDLVLFTGDFIDSKLHYRPSLPLLRKLIPHLRSRLGFFAVQGNHDPDLMLPYLSEMGVQMITHRRVILRHDATQLELIGLGGFHRDELDEAFLRTLPPRQPHTPRIVLCHYPDLFSAVQGLRPDLYLAGHTHGGQICLPGGRPLFSHDALCKRLARGIHRLGPTWFIVSSGMGFSGIPLRLFCPAETLELRLVAEQDDGVTIA